MHGNEKGGTDDPAFCFSYPLPLWEREEKLLRRELLRREAAVERLTLGSHVD